MSPTQFMMFLQNNYPFPHITWDWLTDDLDNDIQEGLDFACNYLNERDISIFIQYAIGNVKVKALALKYLITSSRIYCIIDTVNSRLQNKTKIYLRQQGLM